MNYEIDERYEKICDRLEREQGRLIDQLRNLEEENQELKIENSILQAKIAELGGTWP